MRFKDLTPSDHDYLVSNYNKIRITEMAAKYEVGRDTIREWVKKLGVTPRHPQNRFDSLTEEDKQYIRDNYNVMYDKHIAEKFGVHYDTIDRWAKMLGLVNNRKRGVRFDTLTPEEIEEFMEMFKTEEYSVIAERFGISIRSVGRFAKKMGAERIKNFRTMDGKAEHSEQYLEAQKKEIETYRGRYIITYAQNCTPVNKAVLRNMEAYAEHINAQILVIAGRYKNPTSVFSAEQESQEWWAEEVRPYLTAARHDIHRRLTLMGDVKIQPTAISPLTGMHNLSRLNSCVFGHPKVNMEVLPTLPGYDPKIMMTTGAVTVKNYTDSKAGKKGEFCHTHGFVVVEIKDKDVFHMRQVTVQANGNFCDIIYEVKDGVVGKIDGISAAVLGDIHLWEEDKEFLEATKKCLKVLKPKNTIIHDLFDGYSISHHHMKDIFKLYEKHKDGKDLLGEEIDYMKNWVRAWLDFNLVIVRSNHDDFVDRWLRDSDWKRNVPNAREYIKYAGVLLDGEAPKGIIPYILDKEFGDQIKTLGLDESFRVNGWECGMHGDLGSNGARGTKTGFRRLSTKIITGHAHAPHRAEGYISVGTSSMLRLSYNKGSSSWLHAHSIIHKNGKAQIIIFRNNECTTMDIWK